MAAKWDLQKALKKSLIMLTGEEEGLRRRALQDLVQAASDGEDFDLETFFGDSSAPLQWVSSAGTAPFLSPRRTVVVRNIARSEAFKEFKPGALPDTALLIIVGDDEAGEQDKQKRFAAARTGWEKAVAANGGEVYDFKMDSSMIANLIRAEAEKHGKKMGQRAPELLKEMTGGTLSRALEELEKLVLYSGEGDQIRESDVRNIVLASPEWSVFKLVDFVLAGDVGKALAQLKILIGNTSKVEDPAFQSIFPTMRNQLRLIWQARICLDAGVSPAAVPENIVALFPEKPNLAKEQDWKLRRVIASAKTVDLKTLTICLESLALADCRMKGLASSFSAVDTLERLVLELVQAVRPVPAKLR